MQSIVMQLQSLNKRFEEEIIDSNTSITKQTLEQEKNYIQTEDTQIVLMLIKFTYQLIPLTLMFLGQNKKEEL